ncbi:TIGR03557 family F420-dependent LLM class oxidoreductase [Flexivirga caeni]|uniref:TIGR03557 family F420-dependent LLM class oxidoreductase n=1 Tax=Flexivirga caeni TaxID=2294115 RepID=A0A3M9MBG3_9MICO|nr:TIGR03557 family F420-dependent LLM class oxidoreductase [Flexivirga caeni]RNI22901.1 TIGR03557 family F420-dependent LLM class oxidoreductase [Flexivirga caeni]
MTQFGFTLMTEQSGPKALVDDAIAAERAGFDFLVSSDHFSPWLREQGHAPYAWAVLGAVAHATTRVGLMTYVTCPTMRYHPAVVAQKAATLQLLADGRFTLGLGSGESLNEHVVGDGWPALRDRQEMLAEAIGIIRRLHTGRLIDHDGLYFQVDSARIWDVPEDGVPIAVAVSGGSGIARLAGLADHLIATEPSPTLVREWRDASVELGGRFRAIGQLPICWDPDEHVARQRAHEQFRWFGGGWPVNSNLPTPEGFAAATQFIRPEDVAAAIPCGPDLDAIVEAVRPFWENGFTDVALVQIGGDSTQRFLREAAVPLLERLRHAGA